LYERKDESKKSDFHEGKCDEEQSLILVRKSVTGKKSNFGEVKSDDDKKGQTSKEMSDLDEKNTS
jgi:hypothetical protein